jgi:hypothetical protein
MARWLLAFSSQSSLPRMAELRTGRLMGKPSSWLRVARKKPRSASRWQSVFESMSASLARIVGAEVGQGVSPICSERLARVRFSKICS